MDINNCCELKQQSTFLLDGCDPPEPVVGSTGRMKLLDIQVNGIVSSRLRHIIKRYLKCVGFSKLVCRHSTDINPLAMRLVVEGRIVESLKQEQLDKVCFLNDRVLFVLNGGTHQLPSHASKADPELLRTELAKLAPSLRKTYYAKA